MKNILLLLILIATISVNAQWSKTKSNDKFSLTDPAKSVPVFIMFGGFAYNEITMHQPEFETLSQQEMNQTMLRGYLTTAILSIGSHLIIKGIQNKKHHRRFFYH